VHLEFTIRLLEGKTTYLKGLIGWERLSVSREPSKKKYLLGHPITTDENILSISLGVARDTGVFFVRYENPR
jgi:hypothetical protein